MSRLRLPMRLARREVWRRPGRTALVALLVAIPVAGMTLAITIIRSEAETPLEDWVQQHGQADATAYDDGGAPLDLPEGSRTITFRTTYERMKDDQGRRAEGEITNVAIDDPLIEGMYEVVAGRAATAEGEVTVSSALADRFDVHPGDTLRLERPDLGELQVVGEVERSTCLRCTDAVLPGGPPDVEREGDAFPFTLIDLPDHLTTAERAELQRRNGDRLTLRESQIANDHPETDGDESVRWSLVLGAVVLMVVAIVISAAFAVGARRQLVTLGQLSASGAPPATVRASLVLQGTVTGLVGSAVGLLLATVMLVALQDRIEWVLDQRLQGYEVRVTELLAVVLIGTGAATASALIPARTAAQIPTLAALAGRRPLSPVSRRLVSFGLASVAAGLGLLFVAVLGSQGSDSDVWAFVAIVGGALELFGACALAPAIVARLERLSARLRGAPRLGARALARHRARTGAVVSAVMAAGALAVVAGALVLGNERQSQGLFESVMPADVVVASLERYDATTGAPTLTAPAPPDIQTALENALPDAESSEVRGASFAGEARGMATWEIADRPPGSESYPFGRAYLADEALLDALRADDEIRSALREHGAVFLTPVLDGRDAMLRAPNGRELPGRIANHGYGLGYGGDVLVTPAVAADLGATVHPAATLVRLPEPLDDEDRDELEDLSWGQHFIGENADDPDAYLSLEWQHADRGVTTLQLELILGGVALLFCLFVIGVSLALAAAEGKDERDILTIAGAPPAMVARSAGARAWLMATLGAGLAVPIGFLPVVVAAWATARDGYDDGGVVDTDAFPIVFPTRTVALLLVVVPLVVCGFAWATSSAAQRLRPVRISTATFE